jgi:tetratricopeptide (TPR) repeat protein
MSKAALERAREHVDPHWDVRKVERQLSGLEERIERRRFKQRIWFGSLAVTSAAAALLLASRTQTRSPLAQPTAQAPAAQVTEAPKAPEPSIAPQQPEPALEPAPSEAPVLALAPPETSLPEADEAAEQRPRGKRHGRHKHARQHRLSTHVVVAGQAWRSLAREGRYHEAYIELAQSQLDRAKSDVDDLLLAGDAARLSGHPREAVPYYRDALARAGTGSRAHLAAFTLGRTLLRELGDARGAAQSFERAYTLAPHGQLAEEALASEVESWARAGERARAKEAAQRYVESFPAGRREREVRKLGGLE